MSLAQNRRDGKAALAGEIDVEQGPIERRVASERHRLRQMRHRPHDGASTLRELIADHVGHHHHILDHEDALAGEVAHLSGHDTTPRELPCRGNAIAALKPLGSYLISTVPFSS